jgi:hypothetical protein
MTGPIWCELETRLIAKAAEANRLANSLPELVKRSFATTSQPDATIQLQEEMELLRSVIDEAAELASLLTPPLSVRTESEQRQTLLAAQSHLLSEGSSPLEIVETLRIAQQKPHGRPATKRHLAVVALDMWLADAKLSWSQVTRRVCNCADATHGHQCEERLRQQVNDLRSALKKFGIMEPGRTRVRREAT